MHVASEHDVTRAYTRGGRHHTFAYPRRIDRERGRILENTCTCFFGAGSEAQRIIERVDVKRLRKVDGVEIRLCLQHTADAFGRPALDLSTELLPKQAHEAQQ